MWLCIIESTVSCLVSCTYLHIREVSAQYQHQIYTLWKKVQSIKHYKMYSYVSQCRHCLLKLSEITQDSILSYCSFVHLWPLLILTAFAICTSVVLFWYCPMTCIFNSCHHITDCPAFLLYSSKFCFPGV